MRARDRMTLVCVCVYSNSRNDVPRVAQQYGTIAAHTRRCASVHWLTGGVDTMRARDRMTLVCVCVYSNSRNDVPRVAQQYGTIAAHTRRCASVHWLTGGVDTMRARDRMTLVCVCVYSNSRNDVPRVAQQYGTIAAHTRRCASVHWLTGGVDTMRARDRIYTSVCMCVFQFS